MNRNQLQEDAFFRPPTKIGQYELRPLSAASLVLLRRTNNPFGTGEGVDTDSAEGIFSALAFVYMHAAPLSEVIEASRNPDLLDARVIEFSAAFPMQSLQTAIESITGQMSEAAASVSEPEAKDGEDEESPNGQRRLGSRTASSQSRPKQGGAGKR